MTDPARPAPRYGEYATPEEVAALRGVPLEPPAVPPPSGRPTASRAPASPVRATGARRYDPVVTIALLVVGLVNVIQVAPAYLQFDSFLNATMDGTTFSSIQFGAAARIGGYWLLGIDVVVLVIAVVVAFVRLRRGRTGFWVPLAAGGLSLLATIVATIVVVTQTPGALASVA